MENDVCEVRRVRKLSIAEMVAKCAIESNTADFDCCVYENDFHRNYHNGDDDADCYSE